ncbi:MAG TPA: hypothetical protein VJJ02_03735 [Candidatus Paceibacterota bacterium]
MSERNPDFEKNENPEGFYGRNVAVNTFYFRHAEKASGSVGEGSSISSSLISERGARQSRSLGQSLQHLSKPGLQGVKIGASTQPRTLETAQIMGRSYAGIFAPENFNPRSKMELSADQLPEGFSKLYIGKWAVRKEKLLGERGLSLEDFGKLPTAEQAKIAERAEEPVIEEWLDRPRSGLARRYPPEKAAASLAVLVRRDVETAKRLRSGSSVNLLRVTHKTVTEPLLMRIVRLPGGGKPKKLADIGGPLGLNDGWELRTKTDADGHSKVSLYMYRVKDRETDEPIYEQKEFSLDLEELNKLAKLGLAYKHGKT